MAKVKAHQDAADGCAIAAGSNAAMASARVTTAKRFFELVFKDDGGDDNQARRIAREIQADPDVLAVIGHTSSQTTRQALPAYAEAGIPLLMPVATSPEANRPYDPQLKYSTTAQFAGNSAWTRFQHIFSDEHTDPSNHLTNAFRMIPNDSFTQAPAIAFAATKLAPGQAFVLIEDVTDNPDYADLLFHHVHRFLGLGDNSEKLFRIDDKSLAKTKQTNKYCPLSNDVCDAILRSHPTLIIFCGTKERARILMDNLQQRAKDKDLSTQFAFLLSDNSRLLSLKSDDAPVYVTFPIPKLPVDSNNKDVQAVASSRVIKDVDSYEMFAFDSVLLLSRAIEDVLRSQNPTLSRRSLTEALRHILTLQGVWLQYLFSEGENMYPSYYVYSAGKSMKPGNACGHNDLPPSERRTPWVTYDCEISADNLRHMAAETKETTYEQALRSNRTSFPNRLY